MGGDCAGARLDYRRAVGHGAHDGGSSTDRAEPLFRGVVRHSCGRFGIFFAIAECAEIHDVRAGNGSNFRLAYIYGKFDGRRKIAGMVAATADYIIGDRIS